MEFLIAVVVVVVLAAGVYLLLRGLRGAEPAASPGVAAPVEEGTVRIVLEIGEADPDSPVVRRLVHDAAAQVFATQPDAQTVEVRDPSGRLLGSPSRTVGRLQDDTPSHLAEPPRRGRHGPDVAGHLREEPAGADVRFGADEGPAHRTLADRFDLPDSVRSRLTDPDSLSALVRAILEASGRSVTADGDVIKIDGEALVLVGKPMGQPVDPEDLSHAYLRFRESGARRGIMLTSGILYAHEIRRRQAMAPEFGHAGAEGIQRMADAVAVGADPMRFLAGPPVQS